MFSAIKARISTLLKGQAQEEITGTNLENNKFGIDVALPALNESNIGVTIKGPATGFGEVLVAHPTPVAQIEALEGISNITTETFTATGGSVSVKDDHGGREFQCDTGTNVGGYGLLRSRNILRYRPGQGARIRFTARWGSVGVANSAMRAGGINAGNELSFGYNGTDFGILYRTGGRLEIQTLTITTPVAGANQTLTLTLNDVEYTITLTAGTAAHNAFEIVEDNSFSAAYSAYQNGDTVVFVAKAVGAQTGAFTFSSSGAAAGSFAQTGNGSAVTDTFINQADWNVTTLTSASDRFILNTLKGNVFEIVFQYLGYGQIAFNVEDPATGKFIPVHVIQYANNNVVPSIDSPFFKVGWFAASLGSTTNLEIFGASGATFVDGLIVPLNQPNAHSNTKTGVGTTLTNIISIRCRPTFLSYINLEEVFPDLVFVAVDGTKTATAEIHVNATLGGEPNWTYHDETSQKVEYDTAGTTVTSANEIAVLSLGKADSQKINLKQFNVRLVPGDVLTIAVRTNSGTTEASASVTWTED